uniref:Tetraspanin n=1 Tax=Aplanochytrium stocchinoi TaxID=215587 RepID=A0A7S3PP90_9STRA|mmetsp:Transcript_3965/g.4966  ORF Transcript_3965/g.4966 Transcript_3965/m.4966 type:complete len:374 (-) Transcript_3965:1497-2618(-)|eukprot:CAMPEP_0204843514 /NCGR_PEP_ID=MMETSP1346-20131115/48022_1 /ASSEMBLY_ACC=CAM_ASM_000771 /TAXON_ID=215587 /ORGANISM="Aplanochytrium stocchinoi, Strain GSBS06" /LENGTH=373 /DNA_ID=CAMNT_0051982669 /DNA_START=142 /DNA_END=1263 /DNA_ORIENTATION=+
MCCRPDENSRCSNIVVGILVVTNVLLVLIGLGLVGGGAYLYTNFDAFQDIVSQDLITWVIVAGAILCIIALSAIYGAVANKKAILIVYLIIFVIMLTGQVTVAILGLQYVGIIDELDTGTNATTSDKTEQTINNFLLRSYETCCFQSDDAIDGFCPNPPGNCIKVLGCDDPIYINGQCVTGAETVENVDIGVCSALEAADIVGPIATGKCGNGDPSQFLDDCVQYLTDQLGFAGNIVIGLGVFEVILIFLTVFLIFGRAKNWYDNENFAVAVGEPVEDWEEVNPREVRDSISVPPAPQGRARAASNASRARAASNAASAHGSVVRSRVVDGDSRTSRGGSFESRTRGSFDSTVRSSIDRRTLKENPNVIDDVL